MSFKVRMIMIVLSLEFYAVLGAYCIRAHSWPVLYFLTVNVCVLLVFFGVSVNRILANEKADKREEVKWPHS